MDNNAFDEALRRVVADEKLPYANEAWTRMAARLDAHSHGKGRGLIIPLPFLRWTAAAAAIVLALAAGWWLRDAGMGERRRGENFVAKKQDAARPPQTSPATQPSEASAGMPAITNREQARSITATGSEQRSRKANGPISTHPPVQPVERISQEIVAQAPIAGTVDSSLPEKRVVDNGFVLPGPFTPARSGQTQYIVDGVVFPDEMPKPARNTGFDLAGGYGFSSSLSTFSVGVAVKRDVGRRVRFEGGLALLGGAQSTTQTVTETVYQYTPVGGSTINGQPTFIVTSADSTYTQPGRERLLYLQAAPTFSYRIYKGFSAGGGLDAQRLLGEPPVAMARKNADAFANSENVRVSESAQAEWDFGFALRADYQLTKGLRIGIQHRESLRATADGARATGRSYWLLQAGLRLR